MNKMFTLRGVSKSGKSDKVKRIADHIISNYPTVINFGIDTSKGDIHGVLQMKKFKIGLVSAGDDFSCVSEIERLIKIHNDIDLVINTCRTKGITRKYLHDNYNYSSGWLVKNIYVERYDPFDSVSQGNRDIRILDELKSWIIGLEKL